MSSALLKRWIAQSASWETFKEFQIDPRYEAKYDFKDRYDDFYISLLGNAYDLCKELAPAEMILNPSFVPANLSTLKQSLYEIASGFQFYHITSGSDNFIGVNRDRALLFGAVFYYLSDHYATSYMCATKINISNLEGELEIFLFYFLTRKRRTTFELERLFYNFIEGDASAEPHIISYLTAVYSEADRDSDAETYVLVELIRAIFSEFSRNSVWNLRRYDSNGVDLTPFIKDLVSRKYPVWEFFPSQREALDKGILSENSTVSLQMPTSAGKTAISELVIYKYFKSNPGKKILFLAPFRALASELRHGFCKRLANLGLKTKTAYGGSVPTANEANALLDADLVVSTPEKFLSLEAVSPELKSQIGLIICDEGHLLDGEERGMSYELLLASLKERGETNRKILFISAIIPNIRTIHEWLGGDEGHLVQSNHRPSKIDFGYLKKDSGGNYILEVNPTKDFPEKFLLNSFINKEELKYLNESTGRYRTFSLNTFISRAVFTSFKAAGVGTVALFTTQKKEVHSLVAKAVELARVLPHLNPGNYCATEKLSGLEEYFNFLLGARAKLSEVVKIGILYHHGDLPQEFREKIEKAVRENVVRIVICTNTLAEGVNLPVRTMIIHTLKRFDSISSRMKPIKIRDIKNIVGRAGRAGMALKGAVILVNDGEKSILEKVIRNQDIEEVHGVLFDVVIKIKSEIGLNQEITNEFISIQSEEFQRLIDKVDVSIISLVNGGDAGTNQEDIARLSEKTLAYHQLDEQGRGILKRIFSIRYEVIHPFIENGEIEILKESFVAPRDFLVLRDLVRASFAQAPISADSPYSNDVINFYCGILFQYKPFETMLAKFNNKYSLVFDLQSVRNILSLWMLGKTYANISSDLNIDVEAVMAFAAQICGNMLQRTVALINSILTQHALENTITDFTIDDFEIDFESVGLSRSDISLGFGIEGFGDCILHGLGTKLQLDIIDVGISERVTVIAIDEWLRGNTVFQGMATTFLRPFIFQNRREIKDYLSTKLPRICVADFEDAMNLLSSPNTL